MQNPFDSIDARLSKIEALLSELYNRQPLPSALPVDENAFGDFKWYLMETGEAESTARQRIGRGEVPGVTKLGKRLRFEKATIRKWLKSNQRKTVIELATEAAESVRYRHTSRMRNGIAA